MKWQIYVLKIPTIQWHHERLLDALQKRVIDDMQCVGDVLLDAVSRVLFFPSLLHELSPNSKQIIIFMRVPI
jgi:hypothetical protein